jgi:rhodanese-related sulfurtransferase
VGLDDLLAAAEAKIERLTPAEAHAAAGRGALIVDIRDDGARARDGVVPRALHVPRTVLEWRLDPGGRWQNPGLGELERRLVLLCDHGYSSVLAAAVVADLGYRDVADVAGGFDAWREAGLPVAPATPLDQSALPGMGGRD